MSDYTVDIKGHALEYYDFMHMYLVDGIIVPSITQILGVRFGKKYQNVDETTLKRAAEQGTAVHEAIERYCKYGEMSDLPEVKNFRFLQKQYRFDVIDNEVPVILFRDDAPIAAGRLDMVIRMDGENGDLIGGADIKRTSAPDKDYMAYQLNLYRIAYRQSYGVEWDFIRGIHLRQTVRKFMQLPICEEVAWQLVDEYMEANNE